MGDEWAAIPGCGCMFCVEPNGSQTEIDTNFPEMPLCDCDGCNPNKEDEMSPESEAELDPSDFSSDYTGEGCDCEGCRLFAESMALFNPLPFPGDRIGHELTVKVRVTDRLYQELSEVAGSLDRSIENLVGEAATVVLLYGDAEYDEHYNVGHLDSRFLMTGLTFPHAEVE